MSRIHIVRRHSQELQAARDAAEKAAKHMAEEYDITYEWEGDHVHFRRTGVDGVMRIDPEQVEIKAHLSFFLGMLRHSIEEEIEKELDRYFPEPAEPS